MHSIRARFPRKRYVIPSIAAAVALAGAGVAYAYFTSTGSGNGSAQVGAAQPYTVIQVGAGYDSLLPISTNDPDPYIQDQCFSCAQVTELGNAVTLSGTDAESLVSVTVAVRNWGDEITSAPLDLYISSTINGPVTVSQTFTDIPAALGTNNPSVSNLTFDLASQDLVVDHEFYYGISLGSPNTEGALNIALSSEATDVSVGSDTDPGTIYINTTSGSSGDFPSCMALPTNGFQQVITDCGSWSPNNPGAYGNELDTANIPAVEFDVVGGTTPPLFPGGPAQPIDFAINNPATSNVYVNEVTATASSVTTGTQDGLESCTTHMYTISGSPATIDLSAPPGLTIVNPTGMSITMLNDGTNQDNCEGAVVSLAFTSE